jgi:hypothetical protein
MERNVRGLFYGSITACLKYRGNPRDPEVRISESVTFRDWNKSSDLYTETFR